MPANVLTGQNAVDVAAYVASVAGKAAKAIPAGATGKDLYTSLGCQGCHTLDGTKATGPTFKGLFGSKVKLASGQTVTADEAYLLESILDPDKQISQPPKHVLAAYGAKDSVPELVENGPIWRCRMRALSSGMIGSSSPARISTGIESVCSQGRLLQPLIAANCER